MPLSNSPGSMSSAGQNPGHRDGVGAHAEDGLQVLGVHEQPGKLIPVELQTEEDAQAHVVDAALHGPVMGLGVVGVVALGSGGVEVFVGLLVVGLLEENVGADARLLELAVVLHRGGGDVHIHPADGAVFVLDGVDGLNGLQYVFQGAVHRVLAGLQGQALVAHVLEGDDLGPDLVLRELFPGDVLVFGVVGAVQAAVDAVVGEIQGGEEDDAVAVKVLFDLLGQGVDLLIFVLQLTGEQDGGLPVTQTLARPGLLQDGADDLPVGLVGVGVGQAVQNLLVIDEFLRFHGLRVIHTRSFLSFRGSAALSRQSGL